jgi:hypothetical protein
MRVVVVEGLSVEGLLAQQHSAAEMLVRREAIMLAGQDLLIQVVVVVLQAGHLLRPQEATAAPASLSCAMRYDHD